jgi:hypothetical protein
MHLTPIVRTIALAVLAAGAARAAAPSVPDLDVLVGGAPRPEYAARGATYVEALRGREYTLRLTNPLPVRVAVALAVDGLNTIDARHSDAASAAKWVLDPYETVEISGWQVSGSEARAFYFTGERGSYAAALGETENLGVIEAVFFRERPRPVPVRERRWLDGMEKEGAAANAEPPGSSAAAEGAPVAADEYAATGIGERRRHEVVSVHLDLEPQPTAVVRLRYEFRPQLENLGVLRPPHHRTPLDRREDSRGFERFCPEPEGDGR